MMKFLLLVVVLVVGCAAPARAQETVVRNWHSPETACLLLADIPGMQTRGYQNYAMVNKLPPEPWMPKEYWCTSPYKQIGTVFPIPDNIVYDVTGDQHTVNELKLVLNVVQRELFAQCRSQPRRACRCQRPAYETGAECGTVR
jgi:hypothetical protein